MLIPSNPSDALLARYLAGECSADEVRAVARWSDEDSAHRERLEELRVLWHARPQVPSWDVADIWANVHSVVRAEHRRTEGAFQRSLQRVAEQRRVKAVIAAAVAGVLIIGGAGVIRHHESRSSIAGSAPMREYITGRGQRVTLQLSDGSRLTLAPESRLRIPVDFGRATREVVLDGEAVFDVVHMASRPFRVRAKYAVAEDIGTRFGVRAYPEDTVVAVAVATGAVALGLADERPSGVPQGIVLNGGERGSVGPAGQVATARGPDVAEVLAWTAGKLVFRDLPLGQVVTQLRRWYNVDIRLASPGLAARRVTASLDGESAADALQFVASFLNLTVVETGSSYILRAR